MRDRHDEALVLVFRVELDEEVPTTIPRKSRTHNTSKMEEEE
jgi:hypothetical protein